MQPRLAQTYLYSLKTCQCCDPSGSTDESTQQANRQHPRCMRTVSVQHVETIFRIVEKLVSGDEPLWICKAHVVCIEGVGHDQLWFITVDGFPAQQVIGMAVRVVDKSTFLCH